MSEKKGKMKAYSALLIIATDKENTLDELKNGIKTIITENGGTVTEEKSMGKRNLSYLIKKKPSGIYYEVFFNAMPAGVLKMSKQFNITGGVMRALIDTVKKHD